MKYIRKIVLLRSEKGANTEELFMIFMISAIKSYGQNVRRLKRDISNSVI